MDSFGGHGAFRLGLVRFGWASYGGSGLLGCVQVWWGMAGSVQFWQGGFGWAWTGALRTVMEWRLRCGKLR